MRAAPKPLSFLSILKGSHILGALLFLCLQGAYAQAGLGASISIGADEINAIPIEVGSGADAQINVPFITVRICAPGTDICQDIPNVELDTGSTGLRLERRALRADLLNALPIRKDSKQNEIAECYEYTADDNWWGPIVEADVRLGGEKAASMSVQLAGGNYKNVPKTCSGNTKEVAGEKVNGVIGVAFAHHDCGETDCKAGQGYFACNAGGTCTAYTMPLAFELINPIYALGKDSNGFIVEMPEIDPNGSISSTGKMIFGIATRYNNQLDPNAGNLSLDSDESFKISVNGVQLKGNFDSGTDTYAFPGKKFGISECGGKLNNYLCPTTNQTFSIVFEGKNSVFPSEKVTVANAKTLFGAKIFATDKLASDAEDGYPDYFFFGLTSFYGKRIYFGFNVADAPLGTGEHLSIAPLSR